MKKPHKLGTLASTAICGNDISSSVLYVSALAIVFAGQYAWITLLIVSGVLYLFRSIYGEVVGALPMNGGAYNALLNTTSKFMASIAATLTILSYMATAVISGNEAIHYLHHLIPSMPIILSTVVLLIVFAVLVIFGISESARVAIGIFIFHLVSLSILTLSILLFLFQNGIEPLLENQQAQLQHGSIGMAIFLGFSASMLGVSGFESSANFVETQKKGVFPLTLRNMWVIVSIVNPLMALFALSLFSVTTLQSADYQNTLLVKMGDTVGGSWLAAMISIDAFLVLSGAVLTSFIGVTGLLERMTLDRILPNYFLKKNQRDTSYRIVIIFLLLCISVLIMTHGDVKLLAGVYTISFLSVMALFAVGNILLKVKRSALPRPVIASWKALTIAIVAVSIALYGNITMKHDSVASSNIQIFLQYFIPFMTIIIFMLNRTLILRIILQVVKKAFKPVLQAFGVFNRKLIDTINSINNQEFVFFTKGENIASLNKVMLYISQNEHTRKLKIVTVLEKNEKLPSLLEQEIDFLDREYPDINIEFIALKGTFSPKLIRELSTEWNIPINFMFIGSPSEKFTYRIEQLGGVRLVI